MSTLQDAKAFFIESHINGLTYYLTGFYDDTVALQEPQSNYEFLRKQLWLQKADTRGGSLLINVATGKVLSRSLNDDWGLVCLVPMSSVNNSRFVVWEIINIDNFKVLRSQSDDAHHLNVAGYQPDKIITFEWGGAQQNVQWFFTNFSSKIVSSEVHYKLDEKRIITDPNVVPPLLSETEYLSNGGKSTTRVKLEFSIENMTSKSWSFTKSNSQTREITQELGLSVKIEEVFGLESKTGIKHTTIDSTEVKNDSSYSEGFKLTKTYEFDVEPGSRERAFLKLERGKLIIPFNAKITYEISNQPLTIDVDGEYTSTDNLDVELIKESWDPATDKWNGV